MRRSARFGFMLLPIALTLGACTLTRGSSVVVGTKRPAISPAAVKLYTVLPAKYEQIAIISADARNDFASQQNLSDNAIQRLKAEAAKVGANGILLNGIGNYQVGSSGVVIAQPNMMGGITGTAVTNTRSGKEATGVAIYVIEE